MGLKQLENALYRAKSPYTQGLVFTTCFHDLKLTLELGELSDDLVSRCTVCNLAKSNL